MQPANRGRQVAPARTARTARTVTMVPTVPMVPPVKTANKVRRACAARPGKTGSTALMARPASVVQLDRPAFQAISETREHPATTVPPARTELTATMVPTALRARWDLWARPVSLAWAARLVHTAATVPRVPRVATVLQVTAVFLVQQLRTASTVLMVKTAVMVSRAKTGLVDISVCRATLVMTELKGFKDLPAFKAPLVRMAATVTTDLRVIWGTRALLEVQVSPGPTALTAKTALTVFVGRRAKLELPGTTAWTGAMAQPGSMAHLVPWAPTV